MKDKQPLGHGLRLNSLVEAEAKNRGIRLLRVNAAPDAVGFYPKAGWSQHNWDTSELVGLARSAMQMEKMIGD